MKKLIAALCVVMSLFSPEIRVRQFVDAHYAELEEAYQTGAVPVGIGYQTYNLWEGEHPMMEFILFTRGSTYYGCYYSPDRVPLPFQNVDMELAPDGQAGWTWQGEGDNRGTTFAVTDGWYYFKATF